MTPGFLTHYRPRAYLSMSSFTSYSRCPRLYFYSIGCNLSMGPSHPALKFGEAIHYAIPELVNPLTSPDLRLDAGIAHFMEVWGDTTGDDLRNALTARGVLASLHSTLSSSEFTLVKPPPTALNWTDHVSPYELNFALDIGLPLPVVSRVDSVMADAGGNLWAVEYKTSRELTARFFDAFEPSPQVILSALAVKSTFPDATLKGTLLVGTRVSKSNPETFIKPIFVRPHHYDDLLTFLRRTGAEILADQERQTFDKHLSGCHPYSMFGCAGYRCDYATLCSEPDWTTLVSLTVNSKRHKIILDGLPL